MQSRWTDEGVRGLDPLDLLVHASRLVGAETSLAVWGGGDTSIKVTEPDLRGRPVRVLRVKGSGSDLKSVGRKDFPGVRLDDVLPLLEREEMGDQEMVDYLARCLQEPTSPRPSIETLLHGFLPFEAVIHTHADAIVALTNTERARETVREVFGKDTVSLPYRRPGFRLSTEVAGAVRAHPEASGVLLRGKHGLITWGGTLEEAYLATIDLVSRAEAHLEAAARGRRVFGPPTVVDPDAARRRAVAEAVARAARAPRARAARRPAPVRRRGGRARAGERAGGGGGAGPGRPRDAGSHHLHQAPAVLRAARRPRVARGVRRAHGSRGTRTATVCAGSGKHATSRSSRSRA